jgi:phospholipid transport system substrate-binding protein
MIRVPGFIVLALVLSLTPLAAGAAGGPSDELRSSIDQVFTVLGDTRLSVAERREAVRRLAEETFDFKETARRALGTHWDDRTPAERSEFVRLFSELLERAYLSKMEMYDGERVEIVGSSFEGGEAVVRSRVLTKHADQIPVDYRMRLGTDDRWRVYDVHIAGVSLVANYRTQFNKIIRTSSYGALVDRLRSREAAARRE